MVLEVAAVPSADRLECSEDWFSYRNRYRPRLPTTQVSHLNLLIPKVRLGLFLPSILDPRRRVDQVIYALLMEPYVVGVSTPRVEALVLTLGR